MKCIVFDSEFEFRKYATFHIEEINKLYVFEDSLDNIIYFYCFFDDDLIVASKEQSNGSFSFYNKLYNELNKEFKLNIIKESKKEKVLKLGKIKK